MRRASGALLTCLQTPLLQLAKPHPCARLTPLPPPDFAGDSVAGGVCVWPPSPLTLPADSRQIGRRGRQHGGGAGCGGYGRSGQARGGAPGAEGVRARASATQQ